jgi:hypothetical protein
MTTLAQRISILMIAVVMSGAAYAQSAGDYWHCGFVKSAGLSWREGQWTIESQRPRQAFLLIYDENGELTIDSVAKALNNYFPSTVSCHEKPTEIEGWLTCHGVTGDSLYFNQQDGVGGVAFLAGTTQQGDTRQTPRLEAFECTKG